jgi:hypothetical protein
VTRDFCTYFDARYLARGLALVSSLHRHCPDHRLWVLCLDDDCYAALQRLAVANLVPIRLEDFERGDAALQAAKRNRSLFEYYFTCTPSLPLFILRRDPTVNLLTYLDADLFFFHDPEPIFEEIGAASIAIVPHRFPASKRHFERYGIFNVGWLTFRRDAAGLACLEWWRRQCLDWCFDRDEPGRFADQKYLDDWPVRFPGVHVIGHAGANLASWNLLNHRLAERNGHVWVDDQPLLFFHFHHLKRQRSWLFETDLDVHGVTPDRVLKEHVYTPYCRLLAEKASVVDCPIAKSDAAATSVGPRGNSGRIGLLTLARKVVAGHLLVYVGGRVR